MYNLGYACINMGLSNQPKSKRVTTNRSMIRRTFKAKGLPYASELALQNCLDLERIIQWNQENDIKFYRMSSDILPWHSEYDLTQLPDYEQIAANLALAGQLARNYGQRLSTHPGQFNVLTSKEERVVLNAIDELDKHGG